MPKFEKGILNRIEDDLSSKDGNFAELHGPKLVMDIEAYLGKWATMEELYPVKPDETPSADDPATAEV